MKELRKYKLRPSRKPIRHQLLSGVAHVCDARGRRPAYISFSEEFVDAVGRALPVGLTSTDPAYLKVLHMPGRNTWRVFAMYLRAGTGVLLWEAHDMPHWVNPVLKSISKNQTQALA